MKRLSLAFGALALALLPASSAFADTFSFSFAGLDFSGSGTFQATEIGKSDQYQITSGTSVTGSVTSILGTSNITAVLNKNAFDGNDNILIYPGTGFFGEKFFDDSGVSFSLADGFDVNLFDGGLEEASTGVPGGFFQVTELDFVDVTAGDPPSVPEPSSLMLLGTGILGAAGVMKRRLTA